MQAVLLSASATVKDTTGVRAYHPAAAVSSFVHCCCIARNVVAMVGTAELWNLNKCDS